MKLARKILVKVLGIKGYLRIISRSYIRLISKGKMRDKYEELYFVQNIVHPGDTIIDIGANLGYYSYFMARYMGDNGTLLSIEPIPLFAEVWKKNMKTFDGVDIRLKNCALGNEEKEHVKMMIPIVDGVVRHGLTKVAEEGTTETSFMSFEVPMKMGDKLVLAEKISRLDYVKCDVEGFEQFVIPSFKDALQQYKPLLQIELSGEENKSNVIRFLTSLEYSIYVLKSGKLHEIKPAEAPQYNQDFYFIHSTRLQERADLFN